MNWILKKKECRKNYKIRRKWKKYGDIVKEHNCRYFVDNHGYA